jgi:uncharacterized protein (DUF58 family)
MSSQTLDTLEPRGANIVLADLLRWRLAAQHIPLENRRNSSQLTGGRRSNLRGRGIDFDEVRLYQAGDDVRTIDWRVTARTGKPHTKIFREEKERPVLLVIDLRSAMFFGSRRCFKSVLAAHAAALLAWATLESGDRIGAVIVSDEGIVDLKPRRSRHTVLQLFKQIIDINTRQSRSEKKSHAPDTERMSLDPPTLEHITQQVRAVAKPGSCIIFLSDFHDWQTISAQNLHPVVRHSQCFAVQISDPLEQQLPAVGLVRLRNALQNAMIDTQNTALLERFHKQQQQQQLTIRQDFRTLKMPLLSLQTQQPLFSTLRQFFLPSGATANAR